MDRTCGRPPLIHSRKKSPGMIDAKALLRDCELNPVMAELRELKAEISDLGRSLDGSTISFVLRQRNGPRNKTGTASLATGLLTPTTTAEDRSPSPRRNRRNHDYMYPHNDPIGGAQRRPYYSLDRGGSSPGPKGHSSDCGSDYELDIRFPPPPPPPLAPASAAAATAAAVADADAASAICRKGVQADYGGVRDVGQLLRRVEASTRAVSREKKDIIKILRKEEDNTARLRDALWQEGTAKRDWETTTEASRVLKQRLESTERIRKRQKELIRELQAVEADIAFANAGGMAGWFSQGPLPLLSPPPPPPPPPPSSPPLPTPSVRRARASASSQLMLRRDHAAEGDKIARGKSSGRRGGEYQQGRQRRSRPARAHTAGNAAVGDRARVELEGDSGGGGGVRRRRPFPVTAATRETWFNSQATCRVVDGNAAAGRCARSSSARRPRVVPGGGGGGGATATAGASTTARRRQRGAGAHGRGGGEPLGRRRPRGRTSVASFCSRSSAVENIARRTRGTGHRLESSAAAATAQTAVPRSSSLRLGVPGPARLASALPAAVAEAEAQERPLRRRSALKKARVASAAARFGAPTAASSGKDRRRGGLAVGTPEEGRSGAATPREGGFRKSSPSSTARAGRQLTHSPLNGVAGSRPRSRTAAAREKSSAVDSTRRPFRRG